MPDISTVLSLAGFFDVSLDDLFDRKADDRERDVEQYYKESSEFRNCGELDKELEMWRRSVSNYPSDFRCLSSLAQALVDTFYRSGDESEILANAKEAKDICERILRDCTDSTIRSGVLQNLVFIYSNKDFDFASEEKGLEYATMAPRIFVSQDILMEHVYFTAEHAEKKREVKQSNILTFMDNLCMNLYYGKYPTTQEKIKACHMAISLWETLIYDGNYLFYHCRLEAIYMVLAFKYAELCDKENTLWALEKALHHAECFDNRPFEKQHFTSIFVNQVTSGASGTFKNYAFTDKEDVRIKMKAKCFDFVRDDKTFKALQKN